MSASCAVVTKLISQSYLGQALGRLGIKLNELETEAKADFSDIAQRFHELQDILKQLNKILAYFDKGEIPGVVSKPGLIYSIYKLTKKIKAYFGIDKLTRPDKNSVEYLAQLVRYNAQVKVACTNGFLINNIFGYQLFIEIANLIFQKPDLFADFISFLAEPQKIKEELDTIKSIVDLFFGQTTLSFDKEDAKNMHSKYSFTLNERKINPQSMYETYPSHFFSLFTERPVFTAPEVVKLVGANPIFFKTHTLIVGQKAKLDGLDKALKELDKQPDEGNSLDNLDELNRLWQELKTLKEANASALGAINKKMEMSIDGKSLLEGDLAPSDERFPPYYFVVDENKVNFHITASELDFSDNIESIHSDLEHKIYDYYLNKLNKFAPRTIQIVHLESHDSLEQIELKRKSLQSQYEMCLEQERQFLDFEKSLLNDARFANHDLFKLLEATKTDFKTKLEDLTSKQREFDARQALLEQMADIKVENFEKLMLESVDRKESLSLAVGKINKAIDEVEKALAIYESEAKLFYDDFKLKKEGLLAKFDEIAKLAAGLDNRLLNELIDLFNSLEPSTSHAEGLESELWQLTSSLAASLAALAPEVTVQTSLLSVEDCFSSYVENISTLITKFQNKEPYDTECQQLLDIEKNFKEYLTKHCKLEHNIFRPSRIARFAEVLSRPEFIETWNSLLVILNPIKQVGKDSLDKIAKIKEHLVEIKDHLEKIHSILVKRNREIELPTQLQKFQETEIATLFTISKSYAVSLKSIGTQEESLLQLQQQKTSKIELLEDESLVQATLTHILAFIKKNEEIISNDEKFTDEMDRCAAEADFLNRRGVLHIAELDVELNSFKARFESIKAQAPLIKNKERNSSYQLTIESLDKILQQQIKRVKELKAQFFHKKTTYFEDQIKALQTEEISDIATLADRYAHYKKLYNDLLEAKDENLDPLKALLAAKKNLLIEKLKAFIAELNTGLDAEKQKIAQNDLASWDASSDLLLTHNSELTHFINQQDDLDNVKDLLYLLDEFGSKHYETTLYYKRAKLSSDYSSQLDEYVSDRHDRYWAKDFFAGTDKVARINIITNIKSELTSYINTSNPEPLKKFIDKTLAIHKGVYLPPLLRRLKCELQEPLLNENQDIINRFPDSELKTAVNDVYAQIELLKDYGASLGLQDLYNNRTNKLKGILNSFIANFDESVPLATKKTQFENFQKDFMCQLKSETDRMKTEENNTARRIIGNIAAGIFTLGLLLIGRLIYSRVVYGYASFFDEKNTILKKVDNIEAAANSIEINL